MPRRCASARSRSIALPGIRISFGQTSAQAWQEVQAKRPSASAWAIRSAGVARVEAEPLELPHRGRAGEVRDRDGRADRDAGAALDAVAEVLEAVDRRRVGQRPVAARQEGRDPLEARDQVDHQVADHGQVEGLDHVALRDRGHAGERGLPVDLHRARAALARAAAVAVGEGRVLLVGRVERVEHPGPLVELDRVRHEPRRFARGRVEPGDPDRDRGHRAASSIPSRVSER